MRLRIALCAFSLAALAAFHLSPAEGLPQPPTVAHHSVPVAVYGPSSVDSQRALVAAIRAAHADELARWYTFWAAQPAPKPKTPVPGTRIANHAQTTDFSSMQPCGGDLPPCWVKARESHGNYGAYNPTGCRWKGGVGCFGAWQFGTMWAGKLGLPADLSTATPAQQDEAARELWNGGRGCGNWQAC